MVVVAVAVVIVTAAAPIDDAPLYSSWRRVARGGVAAILCRAAGARRANIRTGKTRVAIHLTNACGVKCSERVRSVSAAPAARIQVVTASIVLCGRYRQLPRANGRESGSDNVVGTVNGSFFSPKR